MIYPLDELEELAGNEPLGSAVGPGRIDCCGCGLAIMFKVIWKKLETNMVGHQT